MPRRILWLGSVGVISVAGVAAGLRWSPFWPFAATVGLYALAHLVLFPNPSGRGVTLVPAVAAAVALSTDGSIVMVLGAAAAALPLGVAVVHVRFGRRAIDAIYPAEPFGLIAFAAVVAAGESLSHGGLGNGPFGLALIVAGGTVWFITGAVVRTAFSRQTSDSPRRLALARAVEDWPAYAALMSSAALFELTREAMGVVWALVLAGFPYAFSHLSLHRLQVTRHTYRQTIEALGRIPEAGGLVRSGTAAAVAELSLATAAELGMSGRSLDRVEYAALLHDVGLVVLANPAVAAGEYSVRDVAAWSAAIIAEARYLEPVAQVILAEHQPYRRFGQARDPSVPVAAKVVRAVSAYTNAVLGGLDPVEAVEALHRGAAYEFDPDVVVALRRVLERRGAISAGIDDVVAPEDWRSRAPAAVR